MFKDKSFRIWTIVTGVVLVLLLAINLVLSGPLFSFFSTVFGGYRKVVSGTGGSNVYFTSEYDTKAKALAHANDVNIQICEEGFILLKNGASEEISDDILPVETSSSNKVKVSVFGKNSVNLVTGGSGSSGASKAGSDSKTLYDSLSAANYEINPVLKDFYESTASGQGRPDNPAIENDGIAGQATGETPVDSYTETVRGSFEEYSDLALVVFSRIGGEGFDLPTTMQTAFNSQTAVNGAFDAVDHYLELDRNEQEMLKMVCEQFHKVVVIINSSTPMELGFLDPEADQDATQLDYDFASKIGAAIWVGGPGGQGIMALGRILSGEVNPSGRTVDTWSRDFSANPTFVNLGCNGVSESDSYIGASKKYYFVDYEEGIYVGYRYYETRGFTDGEEWYAQNVVFPFGYGLSYTTFDWEIAGYEPQNGQLSEKTQVTVTVKVTNTGNRAGKDVVELYATAPYTQGGIEKAHKVLLDYAKTPLLQPNESCSVTLTLDAYDLASYDYNDANGNGFSGYELEKGDYTLSISKNAHIAVETVSLKADTDIQFAEDPVTGNPIDNRYEDADDELAVTLSRTDWNGTWPSRRTAEERKVRDGLEGQMESLDSLNPLTAESDVVKNANLTYATKKVKSETQLHQYIGMELDDPSWDDLLEKITLSSMGDLCFTASYATAPIDYIGKPATTDFDGPAGINNFLATENSPYYDTCLYASECVIGATWSTEMSAAMGEAVGAEALVGNERGDGAPYTAWYAPGVNIHRSPFSGRNAEYYSEDGVLNGKMAASQIEAAQSLGVVTMVKHFAANDQETHRSITGLCTWLTEQSLREIYLKPFEMAVKDGGTHGVMSSFNRIGTKWAGGDYRLLTEILRREWGFEGSVISDFGTSSYMNTKQMAYAGGDLLLNTVYLNNWVNAEDPVDLFVIKNNTRNVLFTFANTNIMNGLGDGITYRSAMPLWQLFMFIASGVIVAGLAIWGIMTVLKIRKKRNVELIE